MSDSPLSMQLTSEIPPGVHFVDIRGRKPISAEDGVLLMRQLQSMTVTHFSGYGKHIHHDKYMGYHGGLCPPCLRC